MLVGLKSSNLLAPFSYYTTCWKDVINNAISNKADISGGEAISPTTGHSRQVHNHLEHYLLQSEWDTFMSASISEDKKIMAMGNALERLFLLHPAEPTAAAAVSIALSANGPYAADFMLAKLRNLKQYLSVCSKVSQKTASLPEQYPESVADFAKEHPALHASSFADGPPAPCPIEARRLVYLKANAPRRSSRSGCAASLPEHQKSIRGGSAATVRAGLSLLDRGGQSFPVCKLLNRFQTPFIDFNGGYDRHQHPFEAGQMRQPLALMNQPWDSQSMQATQSQPPQSQPLALLAPPTKIVAPQETCEETPKSGGTMVATGSGTSPIDDRLSDFVKRWQDKAIEAKAKEANGGAPPATDGAKPGAAVLKRPAAASSEGSPAANRRRTSCAKETKTMKKAKTLAADPDLPSLPFKLGHCEPRRYGSVTIYTDKEGTAWRVKPHPGSRRTREFKFEGLSREDAKQRWSHLMDHVRSLKQVV